MGLCKADEGNIHHQFHPAPLTLSVSACSMLDQQLRRTLPRQLQLFPVQVEGKCRSDKWEVYLSCAHDQYHEDVGCVCMLYGWISCCDGLAPTITTSSRFYLKGKCRSEKCEVYLYGDMTILVMGFSRAEHCGALRSCCSWRDGKAFFGPCTQVHGLGFPPPSGRGRGGGDAGSLLPGVLPPNSMHAYAFISTET